MSSGTSTNPISKEQDVIFPRCVDAIRKYLLAYKSSVVLDGDNHDSVIELDHGGG